MTEVLIIPEADDQVRTEDVDLGENVAHAVCHICHPEILREEFDPLPTVCGRIVSSIVPEGSPRCPDCADAVTKPPTCHKE